MLKYVVFCAAAAAFCPESSSTDLPESPVRQPAEFRLAAHVLSQSNFGQDVAVRVHDRGHVAELSSFEVSMPSWAGFQMGTDFDPVIVGEPGKVPTLAGWVCLITTFLCVPVGSALFSCSESCDDQTKKESCTNWNCANYTHGDCTRWRTCTAHSKCTWADYGSPGCTIHKQCTAGYGCTESSSCTSASGCTSGNILGGCTGNTNCTYAAACTKGSYCTGGSSCTDGTCTRGTWCTGSAECSKGTFCTSGSCTSDTNCSKGTLCTASADCTASGSCSSTDACKENTETKNNVCTHQNGNCATVQACTYGGPTCNDNRFSMGGGSPGSSVSLDAFGVSDPNADPHWSSARRDENVFAAALISVFSI